MGVVQESAREGTESGNRGSAARAGIFWQDRLARRAIERLRQRGLPIEVLLWNGEHYRPSERTLVTLRINRPRALRNLAFPSLGRIAEAYVRRDLDIEGNLQDVLAVGERLCDLSGIAVGEAGIRWPWRIPGRTMTRRNIAFHYDVSNEFFALWLDQRRVYSCAYFQTDGDSLDKAQEQKLELVCRKLMLRPGESLLDIGCGWGGLILWAAMRYGVRCVGITLSQQQYEYVRGEAKRLGLEDCVEVRLQDYRDLSESSAFDKIASIGMFEHVGWRRLAEYFGTIARLLKPGGLVMNHGITISYLRAMELGSDIGRFVERYVFPGGELVHISRVVGALSECGLECLDVECLRPHYAKTLWRWSDALEAKAVQAREMVGEEKFRIWRIYMAGSAHAFARGWISLYQVLAGKPDSDGTMPYPFRRDHIFSTPLD